MRPPHYRVEGHAYHITSAVYGRLPIFRQPAFIIPLLDSLNFYRHKHQFRLLGYAIMPDHIHLLIWPDGPATVAEIMRDYKKFTATRLIRQAEVEGKADWLAAFRDAGAETQRGLNKVWQDSFWDKNLDSEDLVRQRLNYMHRNPVRAGLVQQPGDYLYSSYRNYVNGDDTLIEIDRDWV